MIHELKYKGKKEIGIWIGEQMAEGLGEWFEDFDVIIPIPIHERRREIRGYNQAEVIAMGLSEKSEVALESKAVKKIKHNESQTNKSKLERIKNVNGAYSVSQPEKLDDKNVLIIDDIVTTGSTVLACISEIYKESNPKSVSVLFVASQEYI